MLMNTRITLVAAAALAIGGYPATGLAQGQASGRSQAPAPLEGTWVVSIRPIFCSGPSAGEDVPGVDPIKTHFTFGRGGTLVETNSNPYFGVGSRSSGTGWWERTGRTSYQFATQAFLVLPEAPYLPGIHRIEQTVELRSDDEWSSSGRVSFFETFDLNDAPGLAPYRAGCIRANGVRMN
jgi:hypothetical protein